MERDEEDRVVAAEQFLGAVAVMDVEVDDGDSREPELLLGVPRRDRHVVDEAEAHRPPGERVVPRRPDECETCAVDGIERDPGRERRCLPRCLRADGVGVELNRAVDRLQQLQVTVLVDPRKLLVRRFPLDDLALQHEQPVWALGVVARRVQVSKGRVRQELDSASSRRVSRPRPHSSASAAARFQVGCWSSSFGNGASRSIVAMCR